MSDLMAAWQKFVAGQAGRVTHAETRALYEAVGLSSMPRGVRGDLQQESAYSAKHRNRFQTVLCRLLSRAETAGAVPELPSESAIIGYLMKAIGNGEIDEGRKEDPAKTYSLDQPKGEQAVRELDWRNATKVPLPTQDLNEILENLRETIRETPGQRADGVATRLEALEDIWAFFMDTDSLEQRYVGLSAEDFARRRNAHHQAHKRLKDFLIASLTDSPPEGLTLPPERLIACINRLVRSHEMSDTRATARLPAGVDPASTRSSLPPR